MCGKNPKSYQTYLLNYENVKNLKNNDPNNSLIDFDDDYENLESVSYIINQAFMYRATGSSIYS
jgi:hypothetical protein